MGVVFSTSGRGQWVWSFSRSKLEMLKFPSDFNINSAYYELEESANDVMRNINDLISVGEKARLPRATPEDPLPRGQEVILRRQKSLSEPSLAVEEDVAMETPPGGSESPILGSKVMEMRPESVASQSSAGTTWCTVELLYIRTPLN